MNTTAYCYLLHVKYNMNTTNISGSYAIGQYEGGEVLLVDGEDGERDTRVV